MNFKAKSDKLLISELKELRKRERAAKRMVKAFMREAKRRELDRMPDDDAVVQQQTVLPIAPARR
jgi:hypothetical protein